ncbi:MAG: hypothetical protein II782_11280 [Oscillospiraceae bacterium]|nr:hypothetical protein [Oscillospiraceae bacterium]
MGNEWKNTEWQKRLKNKPVRYWIRDEIEEIIKEEQIDRKRFYEASKYDHFRIINRFYYSFFAHENRRQPDTTDLGCLWLRFRKGLEQSEIIRWGEDWCEYVSSIASLIPTECADKMHYLILSQGWVYEGYIPEIIAVLQETDCCLDDFYVVSKKYAYMIVHTDDGECMFSLTNRNAISYMKRSPQAAVCRQGSCTSL